MSLLSYFYDLWWQLWHHANVGRSWASLLLFFRSLLSFNVPQSSMQWKLFIVVILIYIRYLYKWSSFQSPYRIPQNIHTKFTRSSTIHHLCSERNSNLQILSIKFRAVLLSTLITRLLTRDILLLLPSRSLYSLSRRTLFLIWKTVTQILADISVYQPLPLTSILLLHMPFIHFHQLHPIRRFSLSLAKLSAWSSIHHHQQLSFSVKATRTSTIHFQIKLPLTPFLASLSPNWFAQALQIISIL